MKAPCNPVTPLVTNQVSNPAPHHTTPHHTTKNTSSRSVALDGMPEMKRLYVKHLTCVVLTLRSDWDEVSIERALNADDRPWTVVVQAAIRGALDKGIRHPNGLRYVGPGYGDQVTPIPPSFESQRAELKCSHGAASGLCALCRSGVE